MKWECSFTCIIPTSLSFFTPNAAICKKKLVVDMTGLLYGKFRFMKLFLICRHKTKKCLVTRLVKILMNYINQCAKERDQLYLPQVRVKLNYNKEYLVIIFKETKWLNRGISVRKQKYSWAFPQEKQKI